MKKIENKNEIIAEAIIELAKSINCLGNGSSTGVGGFGAIEGHAMLTRDSNKEIASSIGGLSSGLESIAEAGNNIASAIENLAESQKCKCRTEKLVA